MVKVQEKAVLALLSSMDVETAAKLAAVVEAARITKAATEFPLSEGVPPMPIGDLLTALRPRLRIARAPRVPDLRRLMCGSFEMLLVDSLPTQDDCSPVLVADGKGGGRTELAPQPRPWLISRAVIGPAWRLVETAYPEEMSIFQARLVQAVERQDERAIRSIRESMSPMAAKVLEGAVMTLAANAPGGAALVARMKPLPAGVEPNHVLAHISKMVVPLRYHAELALSYEMFLEEAGAMGALDQGRIRELDARLFKRVKIAYLDLSRRIGAAGYLLPMMLMRRMVRPWEMLQLPWSLSHSGVDTALRETDLGGLLEMLITEAENLARQLDDMFPKESRRFRDSYGPPRMRIAAVGAAARTVLDLATLTNGLLNEVKFSPTSPWRHRLAEAQRAMGAALEGGLLTEMRAVVAAPFKDREWLDRYADLGGKPAANGAELAEIVASALTEVANTPGEKGSGAVVQALVRTVRIELAGALETATIEQRLHPARFKVLQRVFGILYTAEDARDVVRRAEEGVA